MLSLRANVITSPELAKMSPITIGAYETSFNKLTERMTPNATHRGARKLLVSGIEETVSAGPGVTEVLKGVRRSLLAGASGAPEDPDKLFALEASELRKSVGREASVDANATVAFARALDHAATREFATP